MRKFTVTVAAASMLVAAAGIANAAGSGASTTDVDRAQKELKTLGFYKGSVDGVIGPQTRQAIAEYQRRNGLSVTSKLDQDTMQRLSSVTNSGSSGTTGSSAGTSSSSAAPAPSSAVNTSGHPNGNMNVPGHANANEYSGSAKAPEAGVRK